MLSIFSARNSAQTEDSDTMWSGSTFCSSAHNMNNNEQQEKGWNGATEKQETILIGLSRDAGEIRPVNSHIPGATLRLIKISWTWKALVYKSYFYMQSS